MAAEILSPGGGYSDGERVVDVNIATTWVGGSPLKMGASGVSLYKSAEGKTLLCGIAKNRRGVDEAGLPQLNDDAVVTTNAPKNASVIEGAAIKIRFFQGADPLDTPPYKFPPTGNGGVWAVDAEIFVSDDGDWDNQADDNTTAVGRVLEAPATAGADMVVLI